MHLGIGYRMPTRILGIIGEADQGGVALPAVGAFAVFVGAAGRVVQHGECGQEQGPFEFAVARSSRGCSHQVTRAAVSDVSRITLPSGSSTIAAYGPAVCAGDIRP